MTCQVLITKEDDWYVATDISSGVTSQGRDIPSAMDNLKEAIELYYENYKEQPVNVPAFLTTLEEKANAI